MKKMALMLCTIVPFSILQAADPSNRSIVRVSAFEAMKAQGLLRKLPDGSWTADQPIGNISVSTTGAYLTTEGHIHPATTTVKIDPIDPQKAAQLQAHFERQKQQMAEQAQHMQEESKRMQRQQKGNVAISNMSGISGCHFGGIRIGGSSWVNEYGEELSNDELPEIIKQNQGHTFYAIYNTKTKKYRIEIDQLNLQSHEQLRETMHGVSFKEAKERHGIKD